MVVGKISAGLKVQQTPDKIWGRRVVLITFTFIIKIIVCLVIAAEMNFRQTPRQNFRVKRSSNVGQPPDRIFMERSRACFPGPVS